MRKLLYALALLVLTALPAGAQGLTNLPPNSVMGRLGIPTQGGPPQAIPISVFAQSLLLNPTATTAQSLATALAAANPNAPILNWYRSVDISHAVDFGTPLWQVIAEGTQNAFVAQAIQDQSTESFLTGVTGYGRINAGGSGNYVYGLFGKVSVNASNGSATNEVDCENLVADSPSTFPYALGFPVSGAYCVGLQSANIGAKKSHTAFYSVAVSAPWHVSFYAAPTTIDTTNPTSDVAGIWIDATATKSPVNSAIFKNTGLGSNIPVIIQTLGTYTKVNPMWESLDLSGNVVTQFRQDGGMVATISPSAATTDPLTWALTNTKGGAGAAALYTATSDAGTLTLQAGPSGSGSASAFTWTGAGSTFINALNATGNISLRTGATPTSAINISASQVIQVPAVTTGTPAASLCIDASNNIIKKTTTGPCV